MRDPHSGSQPRKRNPGVLHHPPASTQASAGPPGSSCAYGYVKVTTSPLHPVTKSSAPSAFPTEALFRQAGIYLAQGRDRGQRQQCPALSAEEVVSQGGKKNSNSRNLETKIAENESQLLSSPGCPSEQPLVSSRIPYFSRNLKEGKTSRPGWAGAARTVSSGKDLPMRFLGVLSRASGCPIPSSLGPLAKVWRGASSRRPVSQRALFPPRPPARTGNDSQLNGQEMTPLFSSRSV